MVENSVVKDINKRIKNFGINKDGKPMFRVVFSDDQTELRDGEFDIYSESGLWLRMETGVKELPKYPIIDGKWILERWAPRELTFHEDIISARDGDYIVIYIFQDVEGNYLPPLLKVAEIVIRHVLSVSKTAKQLTDEKMDMEPAERKKKRDNILEVMRTERDRAETKNMKSTTEEPFVAVSDHIELRRKK